MEYPKEFRFRGAPEIVGQALSVSRNTVYSWSHEGRIPDRYAGKIDALVRKVRVRGRVRKQIEIPPAALPSVAVNTVKLSDIVQLVADYLKQEGM